MVVGLKEGRTEGKKERKKERKKKRKKKRKQMRRRTALNEAGTTTAAGGIPTFATYSAVSTRDASSNNSGTAVRTKRRKYHGWGT